MREIEIKCKVDNPELIAESLAKQGLNLDEPIKQHDVVYAWPGVADNAPDSVWLRIRIENDTKVLFNLKKQHTGGLDSIEHETEVSDAIELEEIIKNMGYELYSDLTKVRRKAKHGDIEVCFDEVAGLGTFVEAEKIAHVDSDHDEVVAELWALFERLGLDKKDEVHEGYDVLERAARGV